MSGVVYDMTSPYKTTEQVSNYVNYLDFWNPPYIPITVNDKLYKIEQKYHQRPDILSFDLYKTPNYWWVFAVRNPDKIKDPIFDLTAGTIIYITPSTSLPGMIA